MKVLIAEDDFTSRTMLQAILEKWKFDVVSTENGEQAWGALQESNAPQLVILDWRMPGMDGETLCRKLRKQDRQKALYLIFLTSNDTREDIIRGLDAGADDYMVKPYDTEELRARINVGRRVLSLQNELRKQEKLEGVLEMAGAVCHELGQPLQSVSGFSELILMDADKSDPNYENLKVIKSEIERIAELTRKIMKISRYRVKDYLDGKKRIIDIDSATG